MRNTLAIARKELSIYFTTPAAWVVFTAMVVISSFFFLGNLQVFGQAQDMARIYGWAQVPPQYRNLTDGVIVPLWGAVSVVTIFLIPVISMRLFAEEKRQKTMELLMTSPVRPVEIVLGKYLGGLLVVLVTLGLTIIYPLILSLFGASDTGTPVEWPTVMLGYLALLMWGATCLAIGMVISNFTESQMVAGLLTFAVLLLWMLAQGLAQGADEPLKSIVAHVSFSEQLDGMLRGALELKSVVFFLSVNVLAVLLTQRTVEAQRWA